MFCNLSSPRWVEFGVEAWLCRRDKAHGECADEPGSRSQWRLRSASSRPAKTPTVELIVRNPTARSAGRRAAVACIAVVASSSP